MPAMNVSPANEKTNPRLSNVDEQLISTLDLAEESMGLNNEFRKMRNLVMQLYEYGYNAEHTVAQSQVSDLRLFVSTFPQFQLSNFIEYIIKHPNYVGRRLGNLLSSPKEHIDRIVDFFLDCSVMYGKFHMLTWRQLYEQEPNYFRWIVGKSKMRQYNVERYVAFTALLQM